ncbi:GGDEF domain-containing protein [Anaerostipes sp.]|uniref:GGDEF domain-containing protein n=1 Tax=Anaerostipes sp. TaxID=1872530 RepID=UPI0025C43AA0|nr:GGDEF domain-containing protein [Anaerostipes sp.]MBS7007246.1 GGDEF domain-containing protein [Anaerostipes sp.]
MNEIKRYLGFPAESFYRNQIEQNLTRHTYKMHAAFQLVILACQILMLFSISTLPGGPFVKPRRTAYFCMYMGLILCTLLYLFAKVLIKKKIVEYYKAYSRAEFIYMILICFWGTAVTLNDQLGGNGLNVFIYMSLLAAAVGMMKPWQSILLFGGNFLLLNILLPYFPDPYGADQSFNNLTNSFFISILCIVISVIFYRNRVMSEYDRIIINEQYSKIVEINKKLNQQVVRDHLTGLYNRSYLDTVLEKQFQSVRREQRNIACMMIDIDYFKQYNDRFGHMSGDECLRAFAGFLEKEMHGRPGSLIRYGGEEFLLFLFDQDAEHAELTAEQMRSSVESGEYLCAGTAEKHITISIGLYKECPAGETSLDQFIARADNALYEAKRRGRNCISIKQRETSQHT